MAGSDRQRLEIADAGLEIDLARGVLTDLWFRQHGRLLRPLHRAHWVGGPVPAGLAPVEAGLEGDFLSAPFGRDDVEPGGPIHGPAANSRWELLHCAQNPEMAELRLRLVAPVRGARIEKRLRLFRGAPFLVTDHRISGGTGYLPLAHHPMLRFSGPGRMFFSPKRAALTGTRVEPGRHRLAIGARGADLAALPGVAGTAGGAQDLGSWPWPPGHEDFLTLVEAEGAAFGWSAALRGGAEDDLVLILKDPRSLPVTMLWLSNGGRDAAPWDGRHLGVVGIEDACTAGDEGNRAAASGENRIAAEGVASALPLAAGRVHLTRHVLGAVPRPAGLEGIARIGWQDGRLVLCRDEGAAPLALSLPLPPWLPDAADWPADPA